MKHHYNKQEEATGCYMRLYCELWRKAKGEVGSGHIFIACEKSVSGRGNGKKENSEPECALHVGVVAWRLVWLERGELGTVGVRLGKWQRLRHVGLCEPLQDCGFAPSQVGNHRRVLIGRGVI